jgi:hypothetical protein
VIFIDIQAELRISVLEQNHSLNIWGFWSNEILLKCPERSTLRLIAWESFVFSTDRDLLHQLATALYEKSDMMIASIVVAVISNCWVRLAHNICIVLCG